ncbi:hypothetical protein F7725_005769 [Dissostichus mawsoni]|uniref:Voltage-dependent calcium channel gamma-3 subunit n=1 Tax=Dissostichus mawsoni TaxID=36200 RepID=A0A7J5YS82_DISMA|nr:hypothetical protein F7725_005769 [Dissostichus mawsoni]
MRLFDRGMMMLLTTAGAFCAFSLMTIAVGTDYWLYSRGVCRSKNLNDNETVRKNEEGLFGAFAKTLITLLRMETISRMLQNIYYVGAVRASSLFPILSVGLLFLGGVCVAASEFYKSRYNVILCAGLLFVSAGLSNIIGIIVYISANSGDPSQSDNKKSYSYGWSFYFGALSFVLAEVVGVLAVHVFIEKHRQLRTKGRLSLKKPPISRSSSYLRNRYYQRRSSRYSCRSAHSTRDSISHSFRASLMRDREPSICAESKSMAGLPIVDSEFLIYSLNSSLKDDKMDMAVDDLTSLASLNNTEMLPENCASNRRTTPV